MAALLGVLAAKLLDPFALVGLAVGWLGMRLWVAAIAGTICAATSTVILLNSQVLPRPFAPSFLFALLGYAIWLGIGYAIHRYRNRKA